MQIHMEPDRVGELAAKIKDLSHSLYHSTDDLQSKLNQTEWAGLSADDYYHQAHEATNKIQTLAEVAARSYRDVSEEIKEWVEVDTQGVNRLKNVKVEPKDPDKSLTPGMIVDGVSDLIEDYRNGKEYKEFVNWWNGQTIEERKAYLQSLQERMADRYGMPRTLIAIDDLPEGVAGHSSGGVVFVDIDHMIEGDPWRVIETVFHETRHEYQQEVISNYQNNGQVPEGMTKDQVEKWAYEYKNYIGGDDVFEDYYYQEIEKDARDFGDEVMKDVLGEINQGGSGGGGW